MKRTTKLRIWSLFNELDRHLLQTPAKPFDLSTLVLPAMQKLIDDMFLTMRQSEGIGLAAPQIGQSLRLAVIAGNIDDENPPLILINPNFTTLGTEHIEAEEGCLSISGVFGMVSRAASIKLKAFDRQGRPWQMTTNGLLARVAQHEIDHLNGILFISRASYLTKGQEKLP